MQAFTCTLVDIKGCGRAPCFHSHVVWCRASGLALLCAAGTIGSIASCAPQQVGIVIYPGSAPSQCRAELLRGSRLSHRLLQGAGLKAQTGTCTLSGRGSQCGSSFASQVPS